MNSVLGDLYVVAISLKRSNLLKVLIAISVLFSMSLLNLIRMYVTTNLKVDDTSQCVEVPPCCCYKCFKRSDGDAILGPAFIERLSRQNAMCVCVGESSEWNAGGESSGQGTLGCLPKGESSDQGTFGCLPKAESSQWNVVGDSSDQGTQGMRVVTHRAKVHLGVWQRVSHRTKVHLAVWQRVTHYAKQLQS